MIIHFIHGRLMNFPQFIRSIYRLRQNGIAYFNKIRNMWWNARKYLQDQDHIVLFFLNKNKTKQKYPTKFTIFYRDVWIQFLFKVPTKWIVYGTWFVQFELFWLLHITFLLLWCFQNIALYSTQYFDKRNMCTALKILYYRSTHNCLDFWFGFVTFSTRKTGPFSAKLLIEYGIKSKVEWRKGGEKTQYLN